MRFDLSDDEWALLEPLMPKSRMSARTDNRKIMNAIFYVLRTGMPWRDLPERYGPYTTAYNRFNRWSRRGIWKRIFDTLALKSRDSLYLIDSTIVKAHRAASGAKGGAKAGHRHQPRRSLDGNPRHRRQQGPSAELHGDRRTGPRQPGRRRHARHAQITTRRYCRQGLRQRQSAPADQG
jgi:transposase